MILDIHTHNRNSLNGIICINPVEEFTILQNKIYSAGIHPWTVDNRALDYIPGIEIMADLSIVIAIGEIGLDKACKAPFDLQLQAFERQLSIAQKKNKPVIIHCVRALSEVLSFRKKYTTPWIIHRFSGKYELAKQFIDHDCHLSFGQALLDREGQAATVFSRLPDDRVFLETDDSKADIEEICSAAAQLRNISPDQMRMIISRNFSRIFSRS